MGVNYTLRQFLLGSIHTYMYVYVCRKEFKGEVLQTKLQKNVASHLYVYVYVNVYVCRNSKESSSKQNFKRMWPHIYTCTCSCTYVYVYVCRNSKESPSKQNFKRMWPHI